MKKIYLIIAGAILILLIIISLLLLLSKKNSSSIQNNSLFPTGIPDQGTGSKSATKPNSLPSTGSTSSTELPTEASVKVDSTDNRVLTGSNSSTPYPLQPTTSSSLIPAKNTGAILDPNNQSDLTNQFGLIATFEPVETLDFKAAFVPELGKIVVEKKTSQAESMFNQYVENNNLTTIIKSDGESKNILFTNDKIIPTPSDSIHKLENKVKDFFQLMDDLNAINNIPVPNTLSPVASNLSPSPSSPSQVPKGPTPSPSSLKMTYFAQCGDQSSLALPDGCTMCYAGCGAATSAMIASSYLGKQYNLKSIVDLYKKNSFLLGCEGSRYSDAHTLLKSLGLKTTEIMYFSYEKADTVAPKLRKYISAGWTFFAGAKFCDAGCGHFFWITDVDSKGNIWAYDPAYGRYQIPYNENSRYPFPLYTVVFGVKK
jgi:hypothetical protein